MTAMSADPVGPPVPTGTNRRASDRRSRPTSWISRYTFLGGRRRGDRRHPNAANTYVDVYEPWLAVALVAIGVLCALDAMFTLLYIQKDGKEANPIMAYVIDWGAQPFVLVKCGITNVGLAVLCLHKNFRWVKRVITALLALYVVLFLYHLYLAAVVP